MGACIRKRVVYDMSCKRFQFFVNVEALYIDIVLCREQKFLLYIGMVVRSQKI